MSENTNTVTPREFGFSILSIVLFMVLLPSASSIKESCPDWTYKMVSGYVIGTMASFAFATMISVTRRVWRTGIKSLDDNSWSLPLTIIFYVFIFLFGAISWYVSWEGVTGRFYGIGFFIAYLLMDLGAGPIIRNDKSGF